MAVWFESVLEENLLKKDNGSAGTAVRCALQALNGADPEDPLRALPFNKGRADEARASRRVRHCVSALSPQAGEGAASPTVPE